MDRHEERHPVHARGDHAAARVPDRGEARRPRRRASSRRRRARSRPSWCPRGPSSGRARHASRRLYAGLARHGYASSPTQILREGRPRGRHGRTHVHSHQVEDQQAPRQGRGSLGDARVQLPEADGAAAERQEGHRGRRHVQEAPAAAAAEARAAGRQARHAGPPGARAEPRGPRPHRARAQAVRADRAAVARPAGRRARDPAGAADRQGAEAALQARAVPHQEGGHQGAVLRRGGPGQDLRGRDGRRRGDGRRRARDAARAGQDGEHARPRGRDGGARGRRRVRRQPAARLRRRRHRPPAARADLPERRSTTSWRR